ncbi:MAG: class A beta-lactamase-related serine hydrolase [Clostridia bacterium]|nr:class A beta-lactamase-related serine hydrolase [Clostridia bacterium]
MKKGFENYYLKTKNRRKILLKRVMFILIIFTAIFVPLYLKNYTANHESSLNAVLSDRDENVEDKAPDSNASESTIEKLQLPKEEKGKSLNSDVKVSEAKYQADTGPKDITLLKTELEKYIKNFEGRYGVYYYNIETNDELGINHEEEYVAASTVKVPLNLYLYNKIKAGAVNPKGTLTYLSKDYEGGTGIILNEYPGKKYTVQELSRLSIVYSDNIASNMLFRLLGKYNVKKYMRQVGGTVVDDTKNISTPKDMGLYMTLVYEFYKNNGQLGSELMNSFLNTEFNDRIPAMLPKTVKVAHKIGTHVGVINDVGIVFTDSPYVICVMSQGVAEKEASKVIAYISKKVYDFVSDIDNAL